jgi:hypothetical protein
MVAVLGSRLTMSGLDSFMLLVVNLIDATFWIDFVAMTAASSAERIEKL